jgi:hypothetical protein
VETDSEEILHLLLLYLSYQKYYHEILCMVTVLRSLNESYSCETAEASNLTESLIDSACKDDKVNVYGTC